MAHKSHVQLNKQHECGHIGQGTFCHLCKQIEQGKMIKTGNGKYISK